MSPTPCCSRRNPAVGRRFTDDARRDLYRAVRERGGVVTKRILVVGAADTKGEELDYLSSIIAEAGALAVVVDVGSGEPRAVVDIPRRAVTASRPDPALDGRDRSSAVAAMGEAFAAFLAGFDAFDAILGIGGGGGTSIVTRGMRTLPIG